MGRWSCSSPPSPEVHTVAYVPEAPRRDRDAYLVAGYRLLGDRGFEGLTVAALCNRLGATKGSFYHHFEDLPGFVDALVGRWQAWLLHVFDNMDAETDVLRRFEWAANWSYALVESANPALRAWAVTNPAVAAVMSEPHRAALAFSAKTVAQGAEEEDTGQVLAMMVGALTVGVQSRPRPPDRERWLRIIAEEYRRIGIGNDLRQKRGQSHVKVLPLRRLAPVTTAPGSFAPDVVVDRQQLPMGRTKTVREHYFASAWDLLAEQGSDAVTIRTLADHVGLTKGSFRHHFGSMPEFQRALVDHWQQAQDADRITRCRAEGNPFRRLELLLTDLLIRPARAEAVWRAWGNTNPIVGAALRQFDQEFERLLASTLAQLCGDSDADLLAEMTLGFALGLHRWHPPFEPEPMARAAVEWARRILGLDAEVSYASGHPALVFSRG